MQSSLLPLEIVVDNCIFQDEKIMYDFHMYKNNDKWAVQKSVNEIINFSESLKQAYSQFDFAGNHINLVIKQGSD